MRNSLWRPIRRTLLTGSWATAVQPNENRTIQAHLLDYNPSTAMTRRQSYVTDMQIRFNSTVSPSKGIHQSLDCAINPKTVAINTCSDSDSSKTSTTEASANERVGIIDRLFGLDSCVASESFTNRWLMVIPAFATHMCIGSPYAWSLMADVVTRELGFVAPAASDWTLLEAATPLSITFAVLGFSASLVGKWQMKVGPRKAMAVASGAFGGGMLLGAAGIHFHNLELLYLGYGLLGGTGNSYFRTIQLTC